MSRTYNGLPENRRKKLKELLINQGFVRVMEAHDALSGLIVDNVKLEENGQVKEYDALWSSSLCDSTIRAKEDIEIVDMSSRIASLREIMEVTDKPIIVDGDTGGKIEHFKINVRKLEECGVSAVIIEDKTGLKRNSLFGTDVEQSQDSVENFCEKIKAGKNELLTEDFMIIARIESLILNKGVEDALNRAFAYVGAGADGIMIHSKSKESTEIVEFINRFRQSNQSTPIVVVPTTYNTIKEEELRNIGANIVIYANQLIRGAYLTMDNIAREILRNERSYEVDDKCITIKEILNLIRGCE